MSYKRYNRFYLFKNTNYEKKILFIENFTTLPCSKKIFIFIRSELYEIILLFQYLKTLFDCLKQWKKPILLNPGLINCLIMPTYGFLWWKSLNIHQAQSITSFGCKRMGFFMYFLRTQQYFSKNRLKEKRTIQNVSNFKMLTASCKSNDI